MFQTDINNDQSSKIPNSQGIADSISAQPWTICLLTMVPRCNQYLQHPSYVQFISFSIIPMSIRIKPTRFLPRTPGFLTKVPKITFIIITPRPTRARILQHNIAHDLQWDIVNITMVVFAAQITAFTAEMVPVAGSMLLCALCVHCPFLIGGLWYVNIEVVAILVHSYAVFRQRSVQGDWDAA